MESDSCKRLSKVKRHPPHSCSKSIAAFGRMRSLCSRAYNKTAEKPTSHARDGREHDAVRQSLIA
eukprot:1292762-Amphidinium_carterae.1